MDKTAILDFGAQYTQLIARRIREMSVYSEIIACTHPVEEVLAGGYKGIVLSGVPERGNRITVWMSHGDTVMRPPRGFTRLASTANCPVAAMSDPRRRLFAVQFHPEVAHTPQGKTVLSNFLRACGVARDWSMAS